MAGIAGFFTRKEPAEENQVPFWSNPERAGWLMKQGKESTLKLGEDAGLFLSKEGFSGSRRALSLRPRGVILVSGCLTVKGAEDVLNRQHAFELSTNKETMYFIADSDKEKEDWINSIGRSIVRHSRSITETEVLDY
ncbi:pleckstrin homology domain-containing protein 1 isoform X2 [Selaginella moellendorffii]|uniref:pleckstrin homology domain-containing protein 1 isoform X2 n=1 Tax=Selaginella moellendorffii TaxID=88036 RepID=UPI000D1CC988|nr:pleckstrin homology domain-containing protein 1 isoform X2 [Selaginella moellendorffii]|eukprot:XP_024528203.1 pleckstrin homology domain-containing protein 1 isoform X2 [Selaginella moellendorffii]